MKINLADSLKDSAVAALIATVLFVPIIGLVLDERSLEFQMLRAMVFAGVIFLGRLAISLLYQTRFKESLAVEAAPLLRSWSKFHGAIESRLLGFNTVLIAILIVIPFLPFTSNYLIQIMSLTLIYVILATGLNIVVGLAGLLDLGFVAFYAVGAYGYALMAQYLGITFWWALPVTAGLAALAGCVLGFPVLRMHGDYLAIVTLGFGEIIRILLINMIDITGGPNGISAPRPTLFGLELTRRAKQGGIPLHEYFGLEYSASYRYIYIYLVALAVAVVAILIFRRLRVMPIGRAWEALREDEIACKALGINHTTTKLSAFTLGAAFGGTGGVLYAAMEGFINPSSFTFIESAIILSIVVLGGMGSVMGMVIAAIAITLMPEVFREFQQYRMLIFGMAMVLIMIWRPGGLIKVSRRTFIRTVQGSRPALGNAD